MSRSLRVTSAIGALDDARVLSRLKDVCDTNEKYRQNKARKIFLSDAPEIRIKIGGHLTFQDRETLLQGHDAKVSRNLWTFGSICRS